MELRKAVWLKTLVLGCAAACLPHQAECVAVGEEDGRLRVLPSSM